MQQPGLFDELREAPRHRCDVLLQGEGFVCGALAEFQRLVWLAELVAAGQEIWPQHDSEQESRGDWLVFADPNIGIEHSSANQRGIFRRAGKQRAGDVLLAQDVPGALGTSAQKQLAHFVKQARGRCDLQQVLHVGDDVLHALVDVEVELGLEAHDAQQPYGILGEPHLGVADERDTSGLEVGHAADEVDDLFRLRIEIECVDGQIAPERIFFQRAEQVVPHNDAVLVMLAVDVVVLFDVVFVVLGRFAEGRDFQHLATYTHMGDSETPSDQPRAPEQVFDLFRRGTGCHVEIFGLFFEEQVADAAADQQGLEACLVERIGHFQRLRLNVVPGDAVLAGRYAVWFVQTLSLLGPRLRVRFLGIFSRCRRSHRLLRDMPSFSASSVSVSWS